MMTAESSPARTGRDQIRVLVVDDDAEDFSMISKLLRSHRRRVSLVHDDGEGDVLDRLIAGGYDACLLDCRLGARSGIEILREYVASVDLMPIVMLTGYDSEETATVCLQAGAADYLCKDELSARMIERTIRYAIEHHRLRRVLAEHSRRLAHEERHACHGVLAARLGHEIRNLNAVVQASVEHLRRRLELDPDLAHRLSLIMGAISRGNDIAEALERTAPPVRSDGSRSCDLDGCAQAVSKRLTGLIDAVGADVSYLPPSEPICVAMPPEDLESCFFQLLHNALEALVAGGRADRQIRYGVERVDEGRVACFVYDNGCGIPPERIDEVFRPGETSHGSQDSERSRLGIGPGAGFGLSMVEHIVMRSGGSIALRSEPGVGTTVSLQIPLA